MPNIIKIFTLMILFSSIVFAEESDEVKLNKLNQLSIDSFGVSVNALGYLTNVSQTSYLRFDGLEANQELKYIFELESNGYIKMHKVKGLPDGTQKNETFINIVPLLKGFDLIYILQNIDKLNNKNYQASIVEFKQKSAVKSIAEFQDEAEKQLKVVEQQNKEQEKLITQIKQQLKDIKKEEAKLVTKIEEQFDLNHDGKQDAFYETNEDGYKYLVDRNFDGYKDERWNYDLKDRLISGDADNNFDGVFETTYSILNGDIRKELIDSDQNGIIDIVTHFTSGIPDYVERYYPATKTEKQAKIGKVIFEFGKISEKELFSNTMLSEIEFQNERKK